MAAVLEQTRPVQIAVPNEDPIELQAPQIRRFSRQEYHRLVEVGILKPDERVELIRGRIVNKVSPQSAWHASHIDILDEELELAFGDGYFVRQQKPFIASDESEPEPDVMVLKGKARDYVDHHPTFGEAVLI